MIFYTRAHDFYNISNLCSSKYGIVFSKNIISAVENLVGIKLINFYQTQESFLRRNYLILIRSLYIAHENTETDSTVDFMMFLLWCWIVREEIKGAAIKT